MDEPFVGPYCRTPPPVVLLIRGRTARAGTPSKLRPMEAISIPLLRVARGDLAARRVDGRVVSPLSCGSSRMLKSRAIKDC